MDEAAFWSLIDASCEAASPGSEEQYAWLEDRLARLGKASILEFEVRMRHMLVNACTMHLLMANFVMQSYVSDDVFEDFRLWLISNGRERYAAALENPETIADWCNVDDPIEEIGGEGLLFIAEAAYAEIGDSDELPEDLAIPSDPDIDQQWPGSKEEFRKAMPRLFDRFWNDEQIRQFHP